MAQRIADHADSRTTKPYDRRGQKVLLEDLDGFGTDFKYTGERSDNVRTETMPVLRDQIFVSYSHKDKKWLSKLRRC